MKKSVPKLTRSNHEKYTETLMAEPFFFQIQPSGHIEARACGCSEIVVTQNYLDRWIFGLEFLDELEQTLLLPWGHCVGMIVFLVKATHIGNAN